MKKYKTSEAIAMLEKNPKAKYISMCGGNKYELSAGGMTGNYFVFTAYNRNNEKIEPDIPAGGFNYNIPVDLEWELIQEPVDFLTAVKAYSEGKTIRSEQEDGASEIYSCKCGIISMFEGEKGTILNCKEVLKAKWYIEGESNA
jgi:hypothetical protein